MMQESPLCVDINWSPIPPPMCLGEHSQVFWPLLRCGSRGCHCELFWQSRKRAGGYSQGLVIMERSISSMLPASIWWCLAGPAIPQPASLLTRCSADPPLVIFISVKVSSLKPVLTLLCTGLHVISLVLEIFKLAQCMSLMLSCSTCAGDHHCS